MSEMGPLLWLIPGLPLVAAAIIAVIALAGPRSLRPHCHWPCIVGSACACVVALAVLAGVRGFERIEADHPATGESTAESHFYKHRYYTWVETGAVSAGFTLRADGLSAIMAATVTFIATLIAIFAAGYMHGDPSYPRFFAVVSLFIAAMTLLVLGNNFLLLYTGWEGVGLCSYLLIGFWFEKPSAANAARKAFLVTRLGDLGLLLGIILLWSQSGFALDFDTVFERMQGANPYLVGAACLLLFCGAVGKSAQFPLHVWLPDAMEGPTPVSALIHAATMVTAGVYLVARCWPLFAQVPGAQLVVAIIGGITALIGALTALTQNDLKRVLAYSTISQLGFMFLALGCGAVTAALFHLFTHAFFKALLFLAAGSVMHAMGGVIDMRRFGGLKRLLPWTHLTFLVGALALAGVPPMAGFWSKDEILAGDLERAHREPYAPVYLVLFGVGLAVSILTAFYTTRAYLMTFGGQERIPEEAGHHAHESPPVMTIPLVLLAVGAAFVGLIEPLTHAFSGTLLPHTVGLSEMEVEGISPMAVLSGTVAAVLGIGVGWLVYGPRGAAAHTADNLADRAPGLYQASLNKFYFDELYNAFLLQPLRGFTKFCRILDSQVVDGLVDLVGQFPRLVGALFRPVQNGLVQFYALAMILGLTVFLLALMSKF